MNIATVVDVGEACQKILHYAASFLIAKYGRLGELDSGVLVLGQLILPELDRVFEFSKDRTLLCMLTLAGDRSGLVTARELLGRLQSQRDLLLHLTAGQVLHLNNDELTRLEYIDELDDVRLSSQTEKYFRLAMNDADLSVVQDRFVDDLQCIFLAVLAQPVIHKNDNAEAALAEDAAETEYVGEKHLGSVSVWRGLLVRDFFQLLTEVPLIRRLLLYYCAALAD